MELLGSVNKVDSKVILRISRTEEKTRQLGVFSRNGTNSPHTQFCLTGVLIPGPGNANHFQRQLPLSPKLEEIAASAL